MVWAELQARWARRQPLWKQTFTGKTCKTIPNLSDYWKTHNKWGKLMRRMGWICNGFHLKGWKLASRMKRESSLPSLSLSLFCEGCMLQLNQWSEKMTFFFLFLFEQRWRSLACNFVSGAAVFSTTANIHQDNFLQNMVIRKPLRKACVFKNTVMNTVKLRMARLFLDLFACCAPHPKLQDVCGWSMETGSALKTIFERTEEAI